MSTHIDDFRPQRVAILLATYQGGGNLRAQLDSYVSQTRPVDLILASDDGSTDDTREILAQFSARHPDTPLRVIDGPKQGSARNFLSLMQRVPDDIDVVAFSDQDDVWLPEKTARGLAALNAASVDLPVLYCARTWECDADLSNRRVSTPRSCPACFEHALVQNIAGGNTMMLNRAAVDLTRITAANVGHVAVHDWWAYQIITGAGGQVVYDPDPVLLYRQHPQNVIGANRGFLAKLRRLRAMLGGTLREWTTQNIAALRAARAHLSDENNLRLEQFAQARDGGLLARLRLMRDPGIFRQGRIGQLSLALALALRRL